jgi:hypothetical protein
MPAYYTKYLLLQYKKIIVFSEGFLSASILYMPDDGF